MAFQSGNADRPSGLTPKRHYYGGLVRASSYHIADGLAANIFRGDLVKSTGTGKNITVAAATDVSVGVFDGVRYTNSLGDIVYSPMWVSGTAIATGTEVEAFVYDDPNILFEIQADGDIEAADIGAMGDIIAGAGNSATGVSGFELQSSSIATSSKQLKIIELVDRPDNSYGINAKLNVLINKHELKAAMTAV